MTTTPANNVSNAKTHLMFWATPNVWRRQELGKGTLLQAGDLQFSPSGDGAEVGLEEILAAASKGFGAIVCDTAHGVFAAIDHCRSQPVFYGLKNGEFAIGDDARAIKTWLNAAVNQVGVLDAAAAGYVMGRETLFEGVCQLQAGEGLAWDRTTGELTLKPHFRYRGEEHEATEADLADALGEVIDLIFRKVVDKAAGRPIFVPLSGGLDSRLVLAKLVELGYPDLYAFSYGTANNHDALVAKDVADRLNVPWRFITTSGRTVRDFFQSDLRKEYWRFADGLCSTPNNQDVLPLMLMRDQKVLPADAMIVNGQSGDFITGAHIPEALLADGADKEDLFNALLVKHWSLWKDLATDENRPLFLRRIEESLGLPDRDVSACTLAALYEEWEHHERQSKYIVHGQRSYDFHGLDWGLPLWDRDLVEFCRTLPLRHKRRQALYRNWLENWNYEGVFSHVRTQVTAWSPLVSSWLVPTSVAARLIVGRRRRDRMMAYARYIDRFGTHYASFGFRHFARHAQDLRNPVSLYSREWLEELGVWGAWR